MSITNHNILYFVRIWGTRPLNTAVCLWKISNGLVGCGISRSDHGKNRAYPTFRQVRLTFLSLFPARVPHKAQKQCSFSDLPVQMWTFQVKLRGGHSRVRRVPSSRENGSSKNATRPRMPFAREAEFLSLFPRSLFPLLPIFPSFPCQSSCRRTICAQRTPTPGRTRPPVLQ
jgi:hypothetical protein